MPELASGTGSGNDFHRTLPRDEQILIINQYIIELDKNTMLFALALG